MCLDWFLHVLGVIVGLFFGLVFSSNKIISVPFKSLNNYKKNERAMKSYENL